MTASDVSRLEGIVKKIYESIRIYCPNENCRSILGLSEYNDHVPKCKTKGSYKHTNSLREARSNRANDRCSEMIKILEKSCETKQENTIDVLFLCSKRFFI